MQKTPHPLQKHPILTDRPADADGLDFSPYIDALAELIADPAANTPLTLGVFGGWGSGRTARPGSPTTTRRWSIAPWR